MDFRVFILVIQEIFPANCRLHETVFFSFGMFLNGFFKSVFFFQHIHTQGIVKAKVIKILA